MVTKERKEDESRLGIETFHTVLYCRRWAESVAFYRDVLDLPVVFENPLFVELRAAPGACIGLLDASRTRDPGVEPRGVLLSFRVADVEETRARLRDRGVRVGEAGDHPWGARLFELQDPDGRRVEFWARKHVPV